jgi:hypothetical protein
MQAAFKSRPALLFLFMTVRAALFLALMIRDFSAFTFTATGHRKPVYL